MKEEKTHMSPEISHEESHSMVIDAMMQSETGDRILALLGILHRKFDLTGKIFFNSHDGEDPFLVNVLILEKDPQQDPGLMDNLGELIDGLELQDIVRLPVGKAWFHHCTEIPRDALYDHETFRIMSRMPGAGAA